MKPVGRTQLEQQTRQEVRVNLARALLTNSLQCEDDVARVSELANPVAVVPSNCLEYPRALESRHEIGDLVVFDSYHCSRYNTNTGVLTEEMFRAVFRDVRAFLNSG